MPGDCARCHDRRDHVTVVIVRVDLVVLGAMTLEAADAGSGVRALAPFGDLDREDVGAEVAIDRYPRPFA